MPKKKPKKRSKVVEKISANVREIYEEYKEKFMLLIATFLEEEARHVVHWVKDIARIRQKIRKLVTSLLVSLAGITVLLFGLGTVLEKYVTVLSGFGHVIVGVIAIIGAMLYMKS